MKPQIKEIAYNQISIQLILWIGPIASIMKLYIPRYFFKFLTLNQLFNHLPKHEILVVVSNNMWKFNNANQIWTWHDNYHYYYCIGLFIFVAISSPFLHLVIPLEILTFELLEVKYFANHLDP